jgi:hypothetical protein
MPKPIRMENLVPGRVAKSRIATLVLACAFVVGATAPAAFAAPNPSGTGQPNQECEDVQPPASAAEVSKTPRPTTRVRLVRHRQQMLVVRMRSRSTMLPAFSRKPTGTNETQVDLFVALSSAGDRSSRSPQRINVFCACVGYAISPTVGLPRLRVEEWLEPLGVLFELGEALVV